MVKMWWQVILAGFFSLLSMLCFSAMEGQGSPWIWWRMLTFESISSILFLLCGAFLGSRVMIRGFARFFELPLPFWDPLRRKNCWPSFFATGVLGALFYEWSIYGKGMILIFVLREIWMYRSLQRRIRRSGWRKKKTPVVLKKILDKD
ncbi:hypothetical protein SAMN05444972_12215 [Marininema halotolerans]|uniref:Uncharacterized protein n=1 Tax=Marininema halotolerans TaxID=1155944 RepID=A0A1I6UV93_9BACL|nr:hypothetical protein SAMN05444972_12215 [Marininema halotolerans]